MRKSHFQYKSVYKKNHFHFNSPKSTTLRLLITDMKIFDLSILDSRKNSYFGKKRNREMEIVDTIHINGLQNFKTQANISNLVDIEIENDKLWNFAARYKGREFFYRFTIESLRFRPSITNNTKTIFITCNGLNDAKKTIVHDKNYKILGAVNLEEITNWSAVKGSSSWVGVNFVDGNYLA